MANASQQVTNQNLAAQTVSPAPATNRAPTAQQSNALQAEDGSSLTVQDAKQLISTLNNAYEVEKNGGDPDSVLPAGMKDLYYAYKKSKDEDKNTSEMDMLVNAVKGSYGNVNRLRFFAPMFIKGKGKFGFLLSILSKSGVIDALINKYSGNQNAENVVELAENTVKAAEKAAENQKRAQAQSPVTPTAAQPTGLNGQAPAMTADQPAQSNVAAPVVPSTGTNARLEQAEEKNKNGGRVAVSTQCAGRG